MLNNNSTPERPGTYAWGGSSGVYWWVDPKADMVVLFWTQSQGAGELSGQFSKLVYEALLD